MILPSLALLSGMVLFSSAAPWSPPASVTHYVNVSNDTAGLLYDPPYIVSQPRRQYISTFVLIRLSSECGPWRHCLVQVSS
jgi:O-glycosyl hydrolase